MTQEEIKKKYKELIDTIDRAEIYDGRGTYDVYICDNPNHRVITTYMDLGVTPFCMACPICGKTMRHEYTLKEKPIGCPIAEWVRPTIEQSLKLNDSELKHLFNGGLFLKEDLR